MENKCRLSISMLISRYTKQLESCLKSIEPFFHAFPAEFIVVDTGAPKEAIELAQKYATKIVTFEWCDDFSKARNSGLMQCCGDWFLYLDDDEFFDDVQPIIDFLNSAESEYYTSACLSIHNYYNYDSPAFYCDSVTRMAKNINGLRFKYAIHEVFDPVTLYAKTKVLPTYIHHYGYANTTEEDRFSHTKRNLPLLIHECEHYPEDYRLALHLANEYFVLSQYNDIVQSLNPWIRKLKSGELPYNEYMHNWMLENYFESLFMLKKYTEIQGLALDLINTDLVGLVCKWTISYYGGLSSALLAQYSLATDILHVFFLIDDSFRQQPENSIIEGKYQYSEVRTAEQINTACKFMCICSYNIHNYKQANLYLSRIKFGENDVYGLNQPCKQIADFLASLS